MIEPHRLPVSHEVVLFNVHRESFPLVNETSLAHAGVALFFAVVPVTLKRFRTAACFHRIVT